MRAALRFGAILLLATGLTAAWYAEGEEEILAGLEWRFGDAAVYRAEPLELTDAAPEGCEAPEGAEAPLYNARPFAGSRTLTIAVDYGEPPGRIWVDLDFDGLLGEEPIPFTVDADRLEATVELEVPFGESPPVKVPVRFERGLWDPEQKLAIRTMGHLEGAVVLEGRRRRFAVHDRNGDLRFDDPVDDLLLLDVYGDGRLDRVPPGDPHRIGRSGYVLAVSPPRHVRIRTVPEAPPPWVRPWRSLPIPPAGVSAGGPEIPRKELRARYGRAKRRDELLRTRAKERSSVIREAGRCGTKDAFLFLSSVFSSEEAVEVKVAAVRAMGYRQYVAFDSKLVGIAKSAAPREVRVAAIESLHAMDAPGRENELARLFRKGLDDAVGEAAARHLAFLSTEKTLRELSAAVTDHPRRSRRYHAYHAATRYRSEHPSRELVLAAAGQPDPRLRALALDDARHLRLPEARGLALTVAADAAKSEAVTLAAAEILSTEGDPEAVAALLPLLASSPTARSRISGLLGPIRRPGSVKVLLSWLGAEASWARALAAVVLDDNPDPRVTAAIRDRLALESVEEAVLPLVRAAGRRGTPGLAEAIVKAAERKPVTPRVRLAALSALSRLGLDHPAARRYFATCADAEDWTERSAVLDIAAASGHPGAGPLLVKKLGDPVWQVRLTAVQGLARLRTRESVEPLISRLSQEEVKRMRRAIGEALFRITGMNFYDSTKLWRRWWREKGESFELPPEPPERPPEPAAGRTVGRFYGIPVESDRVVFVIDQSSSMRGFGQRPDELDRAVEETLEVLSGLDDNAFVNVILFENRVHPFRDHLVELSPAARATIKAHLRAQRPKGGTNLYDALEMALLTPDVDTVYLLSDGEPTSGKHVRHPAILREVKKLNRVRRITIHCVALGFGSDLLKSLAAQNGGTYVRRF